MFKRVSLSAFKRNHEVNRKILHWMNRGAWMGTFIDWMTSRLYMGVKCPLLWMWTPGFEDRADQWDYDAGKLGLFSGQTIWNWPFCEYLPWSFSLKQCVPTWWSGSSFGGHQSARNQQWENSPSLFRVKLLLRGQWGNSSSRWGEWKTDVEVLSSDSCIREVSGMLTMKSRPVNGQQSDHLLW